MAEIETQIINWIREQVKNAGAKGIVIGLSGGIDSSVTAVLCKKAFPNTTLGVIMHCYNNIQDWKDAVELARKFKIKFRAFELSGVYDKLKDKLCCLPLMAEANIKSRLRMVALYAMANKYNYLVCGTTNKTESELGYYTKYGDGGVDIEPIADLYKTDVKKLARRLKIPNKVINKAPSAGLWEGQTDEKELGITYEQLDKILKTKKISKKIKILIKNTEHKRRMPPICHLT